MIDLVTLASRHAAHTALTQRVTAQNVAHADVAEFRASRVATFSQVLAQASGEGAAGGVTLATTHKAHLLVDGRKGGAVAPVTEGGPVDLQREMAKLGEARRAHDINTAITSAFHRFHLMNVR